MNKDHGNKRNNLNGYDDGTRALLGTSKIALLFLILLSTFVLLSTTITMRVALFGSTAAYLIYPLYQRIYFWYIRRSKRGSAPIIKNNKRGESELIELQNFDLYYSKKANYDGKMECGKNHHNKNKHGKFIDGINRNLNNNLRLLNKAYFWASTISLFILYGILIVPLLLPFLMREEILFYAEALQRVSSSAFGNDAAQLQNDICRVMPYFQDACYQVLQSAPAKLSVFASDVLRYIITLLDSITKTVFVVILIPPFAILLLRNLRVFRMFLRGSLSSDAFYRCAIYARKANEILYSFIYAHCVYAVIYFFILFIPLYAINFHGAFLGSLIAGIMTFIPVVGQFVAIPIILALAVVTYGISDMLLHVVIIIALVNLVDMIYITPRILGESVGLNPMLSIMVIIVVSNYGGVFLVLLSLPIASLIRYVMYDLLEYIQQRQ